MNPVAAPPDALDGPLELAQFKRRFAGELVLQVLTHLEPDGGTELEVQVRLANGQWVSEWWWQPAFILSPKWLVGVTELDPPS